VNRDFRMCVCEGGWISVVGEVGDHRKCSVMFVGTPVSILMPSTYNRLTLRRGGKG
jgi:hypothetical protein